MMRVHTEVNLPLASLDTSKPSAFGIGSCPVGCCSCSCLASRIALPVEVAWMRVAAAAAQVPEPSARVTVCVTGRIGAIGGR